MKLVLTIVPNPLFRSLAKEKEELEKLRSMTEEERAATPSLPVPSPMPILTTASLLWPAALFLLLLLAWRLWDRRQAVAVSSRWEAAQA